MALMGILAFVKAETEIDKKNTKKHFGTNYDKSFMRDTRLLLKELDVMII